MNDKRNHLTTRLTIRAAYRQLRALGGLFWLFVFVPLSVLGQDVLILKSQINPIHEEVIGEIKASLEQSTLNVTIEIREIDDIDPNTIGHGPFKVVVVLGEQAARKLPSIKKPVLYPLIPEKSYDSLIACKIRKCAAPDDAGTYGLFLDQPIARILDLLQFALPQASTIGVLTSPFSSYKLADLQTMAQKRNLTVLHKKVENEKQLAPALNALLQKIDVLLALPDPMIHNRNTVPHLLLTTYRYGVPVIGFSRAYVTAGAIAAVYSTPSQMGRQISDFLTGFLSVEKKRRPAEKSFPARFSVAVNENVAKSLGLSLPDARELEAKLKKMEKAR